MCECGNGRNVVATALETCETHSWQLHSKQHNIKRSCFVFCLLFSGFIDDERASRACVYASIVFGTFHTYLCAMRSRCGRSRTIYKCTLCLESSLFDCNLHDFWRDAISRCAMSEWFSRANREICANSAVQFNQHLRQICGRLLRMLVQYLRCRYVCSLNTIWVFFLIFDLSMVTADLRLIHSV